MQVWSHPIDIHFASASIQGWPRLVLQVWELDEYGRSILSGYGFVHMPTDAGEFVDRMANNRGIDFTFHTLH